MSKFATILVLFWVLVSIAAHGDVIYLSNGKKIEGVILGESAKGVEVRTRGSKLSIAQSNILRIERENPQSNRLHQARYLLEKKEAALAAQEIEESLRLGLPMPEIRAWCVADAKVLERALAKADSSGQDAWKSLIRRLADISATSATAPLVATTDFSCPVFANTTETLAAKQEQFNQPEMRDFLVAITLAFRNSGDQAFAAELLEYLDGEAIREACQKSDKFENILLEEVKAALDRSDFRRASILVGHMHDAQLVVSDATEILLLLRWASFDRQKANYDQALDILVNRLKPLSPVLAQERISSTLTEMQVAFRKAGQYAEAAGLLEKWGKAVPGNQSTEALVLVYREWGESLVTKEPARARLAFNRFYELQPKETTRTYLQQCDFFERYNSVDKEDYASAFELGKWAVEQGLVKEAISAYERSEADERLKEPAQAQITLLQDRIAVTHMDKCMKLFENGNPEAALDEIGKFPYLPAARRVQIEIQKLRTVCLAEITRRQQIREIRAETEFQAAQRDFFLGNSSDAINALSSLERTYKGTGVASRITEFLRYARTMRALNQLEGMTEKPSANPAVSASPNSELEKELAKLIEKLGMKMPAVDLRPTSATAPVADSKTSAGLKANDAATSAALKTTDAPTTLSAKSIPLASSRKSSALPKNNDFE